MAKVLLVDDEPNIRWTMAELLKREGHDALTASDFDGAISVVEADEPDVAVIDIILPRKSGIELLKELSSREPFIPVIMITGEPNVSQMPEIVRAGAYDFISKPVVKDVLIRAVSKAVEKKRLMDEKRDLERQVKRHSEELEVVVAQRTRELAEARNFLNTVLDSSTEYGLIAMDNDGQIILFNRGAELLFGYKAHDVMGAAARRLMAGRYGGDEKPLLRMARDVEGEGRNQAEVELCRKDGSTFMASVATTPIRKSEAQMLGYLLIVRDLTAERQSEEHLRQLRARLHHNEKIAALGRMAAQVAHEVKNPLAGLRLYSLHLKSKVAGKIADNEMALVDKIIDGINQLSDTAEQVLNFARPVTITRRPVDLNRVIRDSLALLEPQLTAKRIAVTLSLAEPCAYAMLDEAGMRSTLINLMLNSIQAMGDGGKLAVSTVVAQGALELSISDTGCGMTDEQMKNVFEPFYTTKSQGLGLGMSFASRIIEQHGGTVAIESRVNEGTRVQITLPVEGEIANEASCEGPDSR
ncbi:MAG TPA: response regulator [Blastocatellia bacterium]|jgi:PAS domain S-box-containing protein|nr:response regulator [Blastocatellia bacterium]